MGAYSFIIFLVLFLPVLSEIKPKHSLRSCACEINNDRAVNQDIAQYLQPAMCIVARPSFWRFINLVLEKAYYRKCACNFFSSYDLLDHGTVNHAFLESHFSFGSRCGALEPGSLTSVSSFQLFHWKLRWNLPRACTFFLLILTFL